MTQDELLEDLTERCFNAEAELGSRAEAAARNGESSEHHRLEGKRQGVALVRDWIRSYR